MADQIVTLFCGTLYSKFDPRATLQHYQVDRRLRDPLQPVLPDDKVDLYPYNPFTRKDELGLKAKTMPSRIVWWRAVKTGSSLISRPSP